MLVGHITLLFMRKDEGCFSSPTRIHGTLSSCLSHWLGRAAVIVLGSSILWKYCSNPISLLLTAHTLSQLFCFTITCCLATFPIWQFTSQSGIIFNANVKTASPTCSVLLMCVINKSFRLLKRSTVLFIQCNLSHNHFTEMFGCILGSTLHNNKKCYLVACFLFWRHYRWL